MYLRQSLLLLLVCFTAAVSGQPSNTDSLVAELKNTRADTNKVNLLRSIGVSLAHKDPHQAIGYWKEGLALSKSLSYVMGMARSYINISTGYSFIGKFDSSVFFVDSAITYCRQLKDTNRLALVYLNKADYLRNLQDFKKALVYCDTALGYAESTGNTDRLARIYDIMGDIYASQDQFSQAEINLSKALELYKKDENAVMEGQVYSDFADIYKQQHKHDSSVIFYKMAIRIGEQEEDLKNLSTYHADLADLYIAMGKFNEAEKNILSSLQYGRDQENNLQLAAAYSKLSNLYIQQKKFAEAVSAGKNGYQFALAEGHVLRQHEITSLLAQAYKGAGDYENAYRYLSISQNLNDSILRQHYNEEIAGLQSTFEVREKDKEIVLLNKEKELQEQRLARQKVIIAGSIILVLLSLAGIALLINRYRLRQRMKELILRNRIAADLHDEVGSSLSSIYLLSQAANDSGNGKNDILTRMNVNAKETMEKMSDIVWMIKPVEAEGSSLKERMERFVYEVCSAVGVKATVKLEDLEKLKLDMTMRKNLFLFFKEASNNAVKYSGTQQLDVIAENSDKELKLTIRDYGKGFDLSTQKRGNGLDNMRNRAKEMKGRVEVNTEKGKGTTVELTIPC